MYMVIKMKLLKELGIVPSNKSIYEKAFTHTSYAYENDVDSYERLEYLGDAVLDLIMTDYLYHKFPNEEEGNLSKLRASFVCEDALYEYSKKLGLNDYIKLGVGESAHGGKYRKAILADVFESFVGALYLDKGFKYTKTFIKDYILPIVENSDNDFFVDHKSLLQEKIQTDKRSLNYELIKEEGPAHDKCFTVVVKVDNIIYGKASGKSKKEAEKLAAKDALNKSVGGMNG